MEASPTECKR
jgi:hypothetical protein